MCLTRKEGKVRWIHQLPALERSGRQAPIPSIWAGPVLVSNKLIMVSSNGYAEAISPYTGQLMGRVEIPAAPPSRRWWRQWHPLYLTNDAELVALR